MSDPKPKKRRPVKTTASTTCPNCHTFFFATLRDGKYAAVWTACKCGTKLVWPDPKDARRG